MGEGRREREAEIKPQTLGGTKEGAVGWRACEVGGRTLGLPAWSSGYLGWGVPGCACSWETGSPGSRCQRLGRR